MILNFLILTFIPNVSWNNSDNSNEFRVYDTGIVRKKINEIFNSDSFIYRTKVKIVIDNREIVKKIIGVYNDNLVTIDNEHIPINIISDIERY